MRSCLKNKKADVQSVERRPENDDFTSITRTLAGRSGACFVLVTTEVLAFLGIALIVGVLLWLT